MKTILLIFFIILSLSFCIAYLSILSKLRKSNISLVENFIEKEALLGEIVKIKKSLNHSDEGIHRENFIKFLSDSRDWAFNYIEEVQLGLNNFIIDVEPEIKYLSENKNNNEIHPYYFSIKKISESYNELKTLLPKEDK